MKRKDWPRWFWELLPNLLGIERDRGTTCMVEVALVSGVVCEGDECDDWRNL